MWLFDGGTGGSSAYILEQCSFILGGRKSRDQSKNKAHHTASHLASSCHTIHFRRRPLLLRYPGSPVVKHLTAVSTRLLRSGVADWIDICATEPFCLSLHPEKPLECRATTVLHNVLCYSRCYVPSACPHRSAATSDTTYCEFHFTCFQGRTSRRQYWMLLF
jgi:hypothetical protein